MMLEQALVRLVVLVGGLGLVWWQLRWLLRAYRRERDRQPITHRAPRPLLLSIALIVFVTLATATGVYTARRIAMAALMVASAAEAARRRWFGT